MIETPIVRRLMSVQVRDALVEYFERNGAKPGDRVLSEPEIVDQFGVGRSTAREALKLLEHDGIVEVRPGLGRYLTSLSAAKVNRPITRFESATDMLRELGYSPQTLVLSVEEDVPDLDEREALGLADDERVVRIERLRSEGDSPLIYSVGTIARSQVPGPIKHVDWTGSLTTFLKDQGRELSFSTAAIHAVEMPEGPAAKYSLGGFGPWIYITETAYSIAGEPTLYAQDYHRGDIFSFNVLRR
ncbi:transcriptional regulator [Cnuibacter physcomitrellae]|uniref:GntR family transcriptional regulator n=1 Tax=Microbacteriaceae TaxID=85023 RepID=UPI001964938B|nr:MULTISPECIES: GntR family transcriptional regulator [Microbacteriaceae]MBN9178904.1 GntR family transcriptional regulator [Microbacterium sp.]MCS5497901.1 GntR family transcriptional regulator [Cnuibacter physcomitrellae]GGI38729.1 transcriptional regulator [Cnuibacter physcomitrellae]